MIRKLQSGQYRLYSRKKNPKTGKRRNLGTFATLAAAKRHERAVQFFKRGGLACDASTRFAARSVAVRRLFGLGEERTWVLL